MQNRPEDNFPSDKSLKEFRLTSSLTSTYFKIRNKGTPLQLLLLLITAKQRIPKWITLNELCMFF